ncbi:hypothetical protein [Burkholderia thailandensis]|uniref:hypothetical protein n=1 Tax=Burkholderia thailandensis TaxID=57975 RepID=UPI00030ACF1F|nr:hypothetical protein [Burkholderia thailandensis]MCS6503073.1 hypothetical protein [Burkholderia thailandensis]MCS6517901.1 hypothetical protein [Burkholderia thailandensis]QIO12695.1 hypothetical protein G9462_12250 [Burkholderia thailandensis]
MSQIVIFERLRNVVDKRDNERNFALMRQRSNVRRIGRRDVSRENGHQRRINVIGSISRRGRLARRARMAPIGRAVQFLCSPFDRSESGKPARASAAVLPSCPGPSRVFRHRSSGRTRPPAHLGSFASVTVLPHLPSPNTFIEAHSAPPKKSHADPRIRSSQ